MCLKAGGQAREDQSRLMTGDQAAGDSTWNSRKVHKPPPLSSSFAYFVCSLRAKVLVRGSQPPESRPSSPTVEDVCLPVLRGSEGDDCRHAQGMDLTGVKGV
jgi:hypothetical protein